jgi:hypothetical protein
MAQDGDRPLLFLDVDGPLIPFRARPGAARFAPAQPAGPAGSSGNPLIDRLDPADGRRLLALDCHLVWATTWMSDANAFIAPRLGLPALPVVDFREDERIRGRAALEDTIPYSLGRRAPVHLGRRRNH